MASFFLCVRLLCLISFLFITSSCTTRDAAILLGVKNTQLTDPSDLLNNWLDSTTPCNWTGITCDDQTSDIISIDFADFRSLYGRFPADFCRVSTLRRFSIANNFFNGTITPSSFSLCSHLTFLNISSNLFDGDLPAFTQSFGNLTVVDVSYNNFTGKIPASLWDVVSLQFVDLSSNFFYGEIPDSIGELVSIKSIDLSDNSLTGGFPVSIGRLKGVERISIYHNSLSGEIPDVFANLTCLLDFDASGNNFTGKLPASLAGLHLQTLVVDNNQFEGGPTSSSILRSEKLSNMLLSEPRELMTDVNETEMQPGTYDTVTIDDAQIQQFEPEIRSLSAPRPVTIYNGNSSSSWGYLSYLLLAAAFVLSGAILVCCCTRWKGLSLSDFMFASMHDMANSVSTVSKQIEEVSNDLASTDAHLSEGFDNLDQKLDEQKELSERMAADVMDVKSNVIEIRHGIDTVRQKVVELGGRVDLLVKKQDTTNSLLQVGKDKEVKPGKQPKTAFEDTSKKGLQLLEIPGQKIISFPLGKKEFAGHFQ